MTSLPAPRPRVALHDIAPVAWEHPADRAALNALRAVPGVDEVIRKVLGVLGGEAGIRMLFQGNAVRVGPTQYPMLWALHIENCATFGWETIPELYVTQTPVFNAGAYGVDNPFIVIHSSALEILDEDELRVLLAHELGHVMSGHALYSTIAEIILIVSAGMLPVLAAIVLLPVRLAFLEWYRKSELSADRAGLLGSQDVAASMRLFMKMAGGGNTAIVRPGDLNLEPFLQQANEYANNNEGLNVLWKIINTLALTHPMNVVRAAEVQVWIRSGAYERIVGGEYPRRGTAEAKRPWTDDAREAGAYYRDEVKDAVGHVAEAAKKAARQARDAFQQAFDDRGKGQGAA
ncbi:MAG: M48 family metallopeptidase [Gemmatimonadetes bacterium]|nr:M48 family metallopeptidase [Gemmatimonadota bacterium]MCA9762582.1 M48 family metallopeptidase [Gemmatimonadota bacterium]MCA9767726.1 M48 family metallopeptidase [Gemmatimonadota bacterium]HPF62807.1 M48 family metallopeptidase [Gemmatimonadales bacterium]HRX17968.1 M48 family metallopeptidase [Gemmatimonadales bacterium]